MHHLKQLLAVHQDQLRILQKPSNLLKGLSLDSQSKTLEVSEPAKKNSEEYSYYLQRSRNIATSDAIKLYKEVNPSGERTFGVLTKLDPMDRGINALDVLEGRAYRLQQPWVGIVNRHRLISTKILI
ncbi:hypothetical protein L1987_01250 [Smallanthus sonchifolius]|uniref:Uncharacterized protein n=1 Tax=Smallanthus sonchifolius TaxID=185202 RepID=A0ACB9K4Q8_9ASTR|nr:hypothetical protein L1987_01250 [Smallanthus sonchifolius]